MLENFRTNVLEDVAFVAFVTAEYMYAQFFLDATGEIACC